jgi:hypothetical protein
VSARDWIAGGLLYTGVAVLVCAAVVVNEGTSQAGLKALVVAALSVTSGTVLLHATARAGRIRELGRWGARPGEHRRR